MPKKIIALSSIFLLFISTAHATSTGTAINSIPYTINTPGMYHLAGNIIQITHSDIIVISSDNVTLDLNGFTIQGTGSGAGVEITDLNSNIEIRNGVITGTSNGITSNSGSSNIKVHNIRTTNNIRGIQLWSKQNVVTDSIATDNSIGIIAHYSTLKNNIVSNNSSIGISASYSVIINNIASNNGTHGFGNVDYSTVIGNIANDNEEMGILGHKSVIQSNTVSRNGTYGIFGISSNIIDNSVSGRLGASDTGIYSKDGIIRGNSIKMQGTATIGIRTGDRTHVANNQIFNTTTGIKVGAARSIIESNTISTANQGIYFDSSDNFYKNNKALGGGPSSFAGNVPTGSRDGGGNIN